MTNHFSMFSQSIPIGKALCSKSITFPYLQVSVSKPFTTETQRSQRYNVYFLNFKLLAIKYKFSIICLILISKIFY